MDNREVLLELKNVDITFGKGKKAVQAVKDASFSIYKGEVFSLVGESGSGKTTIGRAVMGLNTVTGGQILYKGEDITHKRRKHLLRQIQMVFQDPASSLNDRATVADIIGEGLRNFHLYESKEDLRQKVTQMLLEVGLLPEHLSRYPHEFSGGQRQRIGFARAMVMHPELVVADEPISALDVSVRAQVLNLMEDFRRRQGTGYLFIAHDLSVVRLISQRIGVICKGEMVEIAPAEELFRCPLHPYTKSLISAIPIPDPILERQKTLLPYTPGQETEKTALWAVGGEHFVRGTEAELTRYREMRKKKMGDL